MIRGSSVESATCALRLSLFNVFLKTPISIWQPGPIWKILKNLKIVYGKRQISFAQTPGFLLRSVLPKDYRIFEPDVLARLLKIFNDDALNNTNGDIFGRVYEYFLMRDLFLPRLMSVEIEV
jgi:hypothetical protein